MTIVDRIILIAENKGLSINKFSQKIGVSNAYFSKQKKNNANVGSQIIENIVSIYPDINLKWLVTGEGQMLEMDKNPNEVNESKILYNNKDNGTNLMAELLKEKDRTINELKLQLYEKDKQISSLLEVLKQK